MQWSLWIDWDVSDNGQVCRTFRAVVPVEGLGWIMSQAMSLFPLDSLTSPAVVVNVVNVVTKLCRREDTMP